MRPDGPLYSGQALVWLVERPTITATAPEILMLSTAKPNGTRDDRQKALHGIDYLQESDTARAAGYIKTKSEADGFDSPVSPGIMN